MKVREIGEKIGDIELSAPSMPSKAAQNKVAVFIGMIYSLVFWGVILLGLYWAASNWIELQEFLQRFAESDDMDSKHMEMYVSFYETDIQIGIALVAGAIIGNIFIKWFVKSYREKTAHL